MGRVNICFMYVKNAFGDHVFIFRSKTTLTKVSQWFSLWHAKSPFTVQSNQYGLACVLVDIPRANATVLSSWFNPRSGIFISRLRSARKLFHLVTKCKHPPPLIRLCPVGQCRMRQSRAPWNHFCQYISQVRINRCILFLFYWTIISNQSIKPNLKYLKQLCFSGIMDCML